MGEWIYILKRVPAIGHKVLVVQNENHSIYIGYRIKDDKWCVYTSFGEKILRPCDVDYWMPLPELPEEKSDVDDKC